MTLRSPIARTVVVDRIRGILRDQHRIILSGPAGVGKTTLLQQVVPQGADALRAFPAERGSEYATVTELFSHLREDDLAGLPGPRRDAVAALLRLRSGTIDPVALRLGLRDLLTRTSEPTWLVIDAAERCDAHSVDIVAHLLNHLPTQWLPMVVTTRESGLSHRFGLPADQEYPVPFWSLAEFSELLGHLRLPGREIAGVHRASGGLPGLALRIAGRDSVAATAAEPLTREQVDELSERARHTLLMASVALDPTESLLRRAGRTHVREDLLAALRLGLIDVDDAGAITFHAEATAETLRAAATPRSLVRTHRDLAEAVTDSVAAVRHVALADPSPDAELAVRLDAAVAAAADRGEPGLAAELALLAADRTPSADNAAMVKRLVAATRNASAAGRLGPVERAARIVSTRAADPADRMLAQMAMINAVGQNFDAAQWAFTEAALETETDPSLRAELVSWQSWRAYIRDGDVSAAHELARRAHELAREGADRRVLMQTLTMTARMQRSLGDVEGAAASLVAALEDAPEPGEEISASAQFASARHLLFDDRLDEAYDAFAGLLSAARRQGEFKGHIEVLRSTAEVQARRGDCVAARAHLDEALELLGDGDLSPGPVWYLAALVEVACGQFADAVTCARRGLRDAMEDRDLLFTARGHFAEGVALLRGGDPEAAVEPLRRAGEMELGSGAIDPSILPWQPELAEALALAGEADRSAALITDSRRLAERLGLPNVLARIDVAEAVRLTVTGELSSAAESFTKAGEEFERRGLRIEYGRTLLGRARLERRRRRRKDARALFEEAGFCFESCRATGWSRLVRDELARLDMSGATRGEPKALTRQEARLVDLVADGASNQQAATALGISVKTVEATLTRVYRKLGVRARVQLAGYRRAK